jgi:molecular chaperone DnaK
VAVIGIDLGTTNSVGAYYDGQTARVLLSSRSDRLVPSVVCWRKDQIYVGQSALDLAARDPKNAIFSIKRLMGRSWDEDKVQEVRGRVNYELVCARDDPGRGVKVKLGDRDYSPEEISAMILRQIKESAEKELREPVTHAVITVPAYFEERQRAATRKAGELAGLVVKRIIDEPSAAAIAYGFTVSQGARKRLLVFDLGGGTFDVSLILTVMDPKGKNHFEGLEIRGDNWLGGDDFDRAIVGQMVKEILREYKFDPSPDAVFQLLAKDAAEKAKIALGNEEQIPLALPAATAYKAPDGRLVDLDMRLTRSGFNDLIRPDVRRCLNHVHDALKAQGFEPGDIDVVLLVGGSTLVPAVRDAVTEVFGPERVKQVTDPFHSIALGAAILAATLEGLQCPDCSEVNEETASRCRKCGAGLAAAPSVGAISLTETTAMAFGISAVRGEDADSFAPIIEKGTVYPLREPRSRVFETTAENFIQIPVYEGNDPRASRNEQQGVVELNQEDFQNEGISVPAGTPVEVAMTYDRNRAIYVRLHVPGTSMRREFYLRRDRARVVARAVDVDALRETVDGLLGAADDLRNDYAEFMEPRDQRRLEAAMERTRQALNGDAPGELRQAATALNVALESCGVASLLFLAERIRSGAPPERAQRFTVAIRQIRAGWGAKDRKEAVQAITRQLRDALNAEMAVRRQHKTLPGQLDFGGKLRIPDR